ncbi:adenylate kinase [Primorskyibacter sp. S187A]|uniref:adenylate kinase n=1 Tax=Primorskyibacter sp. S187A TaxID=3415130 RepID=UPI003C7EAA77
MTQDASTTATIKRVTVFGKPAGGKSTLSRRISEATGIALFPLDLLEYSQNGDLVDRNVFHQKHAELIASDEWVIEGLGTMRSFWDRIDAADTLVYVDLPYRIHYWWVIKRFLKGPFVRPLGWPEGSSVLKGTLAGFKYLKLSRGFWTQDLLEKIKARAKGKTLHHITSLKQLNTFTDNL